LTLKCEQSGGRPRQDFSNSNRCVRSIRLEGRRLLERNQGSLVTFVAHPAKPRKQRNIRGLNRPEGRSRWVVEDRSDIPILRKDDAHQWMDPSDSQQFPLSVAWRISRERG